MTIIFYILLILQVKSTQGYHCHVCSIHVIGYSASSHDLQSPMYDDCDIRSATHSCYIRIDWLSDGTTEISYETNSLIPIDSVVVSTRRHIDFHTGEYSTVQSIGYSCGSNRTSCNTVKTLKRILSAITLPIDQQLRRLDNFIYPMNAFNGSSCSMMTSNRNHHCSIKNSIDCKQCVGSVIQYLDHSDWCSTCLTNQTNGNFIDYEVVISLRTNSQLEKVNVVCQTHAHCNSLENMNRIKEILAIDFNPTKFFHSKASTTTMSTLVLIISTIFTFVSGLFSSQ